MCVGIDPIKTLANHIAKEQPQLAGVCDLASLPPAEVDQLLATSRERFFKSTGGTQH